MIDNSGSMGGTSIQQAKASLLYALRRLQPNDRFNVIRFDDTMDVVFPASVPADAEHIGTASAFVDALQARGGTEMVPAMRAALTDSNSGDGTFVRQVVFLTDGAIGNEQQLFETIAAMRGRSRVFMIGIGSAPNTFLMTRAAEIGRGAFTHIGSVDQVEERMRGLFAKLENPAVTGLTAKFSDAKADVTPAVLPDIYRGEPLVLAAKLDKLAGTFEIKGRVGDRPWVVTLPIANAAEGKGLSKLWARRKIDDAEVARTLRQAGPEEADKAILALALEHQLVTRLTSLVAVDKTPTRPDGAPLKLTELPLNLPAGWDFEKVFGERPKPPAPPAERRAELGNAHAQLASLKRPVVQPAPSTITAAEDSDRCRTQHDRRFDPAGAEPDPVGLQPAPLVCALTPDERRRRDLPPLPPARAAFRPPEAARATHSPRSEAQCPASPPNDSPRFALAGLLLFGHGGYIHAKAILAQVLLERAFTESIASHHPVKPWSWADTWPVARIEVKRLHASTIVLAGSSGQALAFGPGHVELTPDAGERGVAVYSAHRDTHFRFLRNVLVGDEIDVTRNDGETFRYRADATAVVRYDESGIDPLTAGYELVLTTCWPFDALTPGPERYILHATMIRPEFSEIAGRQHKLPAAAASRLATVDPMGSQVHYLPLTPGLFSVLVLLFAGLIILIQLRVLRYAYMKLGVGPGMALALLFGSLIGSYFNIPVTILPGHTIQTGEIVDFYGMRYVVPYVTSWPPGTVLAVNVGGAVIPTLMSTYLVLRYQLWVKAAIAVVVIAIVIHASATPVQGVGIAVPVFAPVIATAILAFILSREYAAPLAYIGGSMGTLIGADLMNLDKIGGLGAPVASIGGAGTFDGIFLTGILAVLLAGLASPPRPREVW